MFSIIAPSKISRLILVKILLFSLLISCFSVGIQLYVDFQRDINFLEESMQNSLDTSTDAIKNAVWEYNEKQIEYQLSGLVAQPFLVGAKIDYGESFAEEKVFGDANEANLRKKVVSLDAQIQGTSKTLANITIYGDIEAVYDKTRQRLWVIMLSEGVKTFLVSIFILQLINKIVLDRILTMERWSEKNARSNSPSKLVFSQSDKRPKDELDVLSGRLNMMAKALHNYNQNLTQQVKDRTLELEKAKELAESATKAKSNFLSTMSHEIRTPMNAVIGLSHLALKAEQDSGQKDYLEKIRSSADSLLSLINDILDFSKIESGNLQIDKTAFELDNVLQSSINLVSIKAQEKGLELVIYISPEVPKFLIGDPFRLQQILTNLCSNAIKFTASGVISVVISSEPCSNGIRLKGSVHDTGIGMTEEQMQQVFNSFSQAKKSTTRDYGGTGLGLAICKQLTELMNGNIHVESDFGNSSTFIFNVFLQINKERRQHETLSQNKLKNLRVLVVDDIELSRKMFCETLERVEIVADSAEDGETALRMINDISSTDKNYDLVLLDWQMPGLDGIAMLSHFTNYHPDLIDKTIMLSAYEIDTLKDKATPFGVNKFLEKPVNPYFLTDFLISVVSENQVKSPLPKNKLSIPDLQHYSILLVEDGKLNQQVATGFLKYTGTHIDIVQNGEEALNRLKKCNDYDLVLMDIQMPIMDGLTAARLAREHGIEIPIIAMTAHATVSDQEKSKSAGMNAHINKPIDIKELYKTLTRFLKGSENQVPTPNRIPNIKPDRISKTKPDERPDVKPMMTSENIHLSSSFVDRLKALKSLDTKHALNMLAGQDHLLEKMVKGFVANKETQKVLESNISSLNHNLLYRTAHSLKTNAEYIGAIKLSNVAIRLESLINEKGNDDDIKALTQSVLQELVTLQKQLSDIDIQPSANSDISEYKSLTIKETIEHLKRATQHGDAKSVVIAEELLNKCINTELENDARALYSLLQDYEFDAAISKLATLKSA